MKWPLLGVISLVLVMMAANAVNFVRTFSLVELAQPPLVFLVGIYAAGIIVPVALGRWIILRERAEFGWRLIFERRPQHPTLAQAWMAGRIAVVALSTVTLLVIAFAAVGWFTSR